jgi:hypothetical protein
MQRHRGEDKYKRVLVGGTIDTKRPHSREKLGEVFCIKGKNTCYCKGYSQLTIENCEA